MRIVRLIKFTWSRLLEAFEMRSELKACERYGEILREVALPLTGNRPFASGPHPEMLANQQMELRRLKYRLELDETLDTVSKQLSDQV